MEAPQTTRQQKVAKQIQKDISEIFTKETSDLFRGVMASVTTVRMSPDLGYAKVYVSVFPFDKSAETMSAITANDWKIRKLLGSRIRNQLRTVPELAFFLDDSLEYIENIDNLLK
jgi:ribosome-binding factor A